MLSTEDSNEYHGPMAMLSTEDSNEHHFPILMLSRPTEDGNKHEPMSMLSTEIAINMITLQCCLLKIAVSITTNLNGVY